jgi:hypothetical protein
MIPMTLDELKEAILAIIPGADFDETPDGEIAIFTGLVEDLNGELEPIEEDFDPELEEEFGGDEPSAPENE